MKIEMPPKNNLGNSKASLQYLLLFKHNFQTINRQLVKDQNLSVLMDMFKQHTSNSSYISLTVSIPF